MDNPEDEDPEDEDPEDLDFSDLVYQAEEGTPTSSQNLPSSGSQFSPSQPSSKYSDQDVPDSQPEKEGVNQSEP